MKIILLENVRKVGSIGQIIDVKRGFARNFLIAQKKALFASIIFLYLSSICLIWLGEIAWLAISVCS